METKAISKGFVNRDTLEDLAEVKKNVVGDLRTAIEKKNHIFKKDSWESAGEASRVGGEASRVGGEASRVGGEASTNGSVPGAKDDAFLKSDGRNGHTKHPVDPGKKVESGAREVSRRSVVEVEVGGGEGGARRRHLSSGEVEGRSTVDSSPHLSHQPMGRLSPCPEQPPTGRGPLSRKPFFGS